MMNDFNYVLGDPYVVKLDVRSVTIATAVNFGILKTSSLVVTDSPEGNYDGFWPTLNGHFYIDPFYAGNIYLII